MHELSFLILRDLHGLIETEVFRIPGLYNKPSFKTFEQA